MTWAGGFLGTIGALPAAGDEPPVTVGRTPAREAAERELSRPRYHENDPSLFQRALNRFWDWVGDLFDAASGATPGGGLGLVVILLVAVALLALLWWRLGRPERTGTPSSALFDERPRTAAEHRAAAEAHATDGRWSQAVQERMRALVRSLEERALLDPRPGRTADEAATEAGRSLPAHAARLVAAARDFDDITYGGRTADETAYRRMTELDGDVERTKPELVETAHGADA
ncbi:hypothetical protein DSC45_07705 [Streptomyces sp. YIM 130001]|uniref:DUF4129 domain-containing protein n=1 Tax=Streptomyces sp. YIM 130001 TaxID=2259644 RepID=UPI000E65878D|nr:DUF4129 domain-containing protein [Streptomyces sp. YIM 130001]RII19880.1 hypothetical protein DSC45_07705 [Streptomyces sp. YIM 130001]